MDNIFNSNVAPKRRVKPARRDWVCSVCKTPIYKFYIRCPSCGTKGN